MEKPHQQIEIMMQLEISVIEVNKISINKLSNVSGLILDKSLLGLTIHEDNFSEV